LAPLFRRCFCCSSSVSSSSDIGKAVDEIRGEDDDVDKSSELERESSMSCRTSYIDNERDSNVVVECESNLDGDLDEMDEGQLIEEVVRREAVSVQREQSRLPIQEAVNSPIAGSIFGTSEASLPHHIEL